MIIRAIAWDIDGTLVDSEPLHHEALVMTCKRWQVDLSDFSGEDFQGLHLPEIWLALADRMPPTLTKEAWADAITDYYAGRSSGLLPTPGAIDTIGHFAMRRIKQVCVSNSGRAVVDANLRALGIANLMAFSISLDDVSQGKPDPEPYAMACDKLGIRPEQVLAVEDSVAGVRSARAAGLVTALYCSNGRQQVEADFVFADLRQLISITDGFSANVSSSFAGPQIVT